ncbi:MAG: hypothetical protein ACLSBB_11440 [Ruthenibacterium lactatiformans]
METEVKTRRKIQLRMPGRRTATGKNVNWILMKRNKVLYLFILPAFLYFLIFAYVPMYGVQIAFKDFVANKAWGSIKQTCCSHFITFFSSVTWEILRNTIGLRIISPSVSMPILLALMINEVKNTRFKRLCRTLLICHTCVHRGARRHDQSVLSTNFQHTSALFERSRRCS